MEMSNQYTFTTGILNTGSQRHPCHDVVWYQNRSVVQVPGGFGSVAPIEHSVQHMVEEVSFSVPRLITLNSSWAYELILPTPAQLIRKNILITSFQHTTGSTLVTARVSLDSIEGPREQTTDTTAATAMAVENPFVEVNSESTKKEILSLDEHLKKEGKDFKSILDEDIEDIDNICEKLRGVVENG